MTSFVGGFRLSGSTPHVEQVLVPTLRPGNTVVTDDLPAYKVPAVHLAIETARTHLMLLPPYSPDFNAIEMAVKTHLRSAAARTLPSLWDVIAAITE